MKNINILIGFCFGFLFTFNCTSQNSQNRNIISPKKYEQDSVIKVERDYNLAVLKENNVFLEDLVNCQGLQKLRTLLNEKELSYDSYFDEKWNPSFIACKCGDKKILKHLWKEDNFLTLKNKYKESVLMFAVEGNQVDLVKKLLQSGSNIQDKDDLNRSVLMRGAENGNSAMIRLLIDSGADIFQSQYKEGSDNPLVIAIRNCNFSGFLTLRDEFLNQEKENLLKKRQFVFTAINVGCLKVVQELLPYHSIDITGFRQSNMIQAATEFAVAHDNYVRSGYYEVRDSQEIDVDVDLKILQLLSDFGVDQHIIDAKGESILFRCIESPTLTEFFLGKNVDPNVIDKKGRTVLMCAISNMLSDPKWETGIDVLIHDDPIKTKNILAVIEYLILGNGIINESNKEWNSDVLELAKDKRNSDLVLKMNEIFRKTKFDFEL